MGGSKRQTVGYEYPYDLQFGLCYAADALLEFRGGDATAWAGQITTNATVGVNAPHLWGGQDNGGEGGIVGLMDVMFGDADQEPHPYLVEHFGQDSALRGKVTVLLRDTIYGAYNPYPKPPAFKVRRIFAGWPDDEPWYPETASLALEGGTTIVRFFRERFEDGMGEWSPDGSPPSNFEVVSIDGINAMQVGPGPQAGIVRTIEPTLLVGWSIRVKLLAHSNSDWCVFDVNARNGPGVAFGRHGNRNQVNLGWPGHTRLLTGPELQVGHWYRAEARYDPETETALLRVTDETSGQVWAEAQGPAAPPMDIASSVVLRNDDGANMAAWTDIELFTSVGSGAMNPAHMLYYSKVSPTMEGLPASALDDASWRAVAERLQAESFGLCTDWVPGAESVEQFQKRICNVIGGFLAKSRRDGKWRLRLPRGDYDLESLPILTDDDILEWKEEPSTLDDAVNQLQTRWFDPVLKATRITPSEHALGAIDAFGGVISQTVDYPEIPSESLALRKNSQELLARSTPFRRINPVCTRKAALWDVGEYIRIQCPKRGIEDMVMLLMANDVGESPTSAVRIKAMEDIYTMPETSYTGPQEPADFNPSQIPLPTPEQRAFEAPYIELAATLPHAELAALPPESGYLLFVAQQPASGVNYTLATAATGEEFDEHDLGDWCPTALVNEPGDHDRTEFTLSGATRLQGVAVGSAALWGDELCRVDALDLEASPITLTLGRGCGDTVPGLHEPGSRIWFYGEWGTTDQREYALGETVAAKALTRTTRDRLLLADAPTATVEMDERHVRPYPPANVRLNGESHPVQVTGDVVLTAAHRDRLLQADQLVDQLAGDIGPEPGTTYVVRNVNAATDVETYFADGIAEWPHTVPSSALAASNRMEIYSVRDGYESWQRVVVEFTVGAFLQAEDGSPITAEDSDPIIME